MVLKVTSTTGQTKAIKPKTPPTLIYDAETNTFEVWRGETLVKRVEIKKPRTLEWLDRHLPEDAEWQFGQNTNGTTYLIESGDTHA